MKKFTIPKINEKVKQEFSFINGRIFPWTEGRFIVYVFCPEEPRIHPTYLVSDKLSEIMVRFSDSPIGQYPISLIADKNNEKFYFEIFVGPHNANAFCTFPEKNVIDLDKRACGLGEPFGGETIVRVGNVGLISGYQNYYNDKKLNKFILKNIKLKESEFALFKFHDNHYDIKIMDFCTHDEGKVVSMAISLDKLTASVLIGHKEQPWEVVVFDLE